MSLRSDLSKIIPAFTAYKFLQALVQPFEKFDAYKLGIIDKNGNFLKKSKDLKKAKEKKAASMFFRIIINLKKLLGDIKSPTTKQRLRGINTALFLIKEEVDKIGGDSDEINRIFYEFIQETDPELYEEIAGGSPPANVAASGNVAGLGYNIRLGNVPPDDLVIKPRKTKMIRRKKKDEDE